MDDTKELLRKIAALRRRLEDDRQQALADPLLSIQKQIAAGSAHANLIENTLKSIEPAQSPVPRLTARGSRVLRRGKELLHALRAMIEESALQKDENDPLTVLYVETAAMLDTVLRAAQAFPQSAGEQLRVCEGLEAVLRVVDERVGVLEAGLEHRLREQGRIDYLGEILNRLADGQPVGLQPLQTLAQTLIDEAHAGMPLRFHEASPSDPGRFAAAHGLTVAQVLARLLLQDADWQNRLPTAVMAALVHDVGMARVPAEVLGKPGPLDDDERRLVERHVAVAGPMVEQLWPGGGWPVEAATDHHERSDGTGYPLGRKEIQLSSFVRLLSLCDAYAALGAARPHRPGLDTRSALTETLLMADRDILDKTQAQRLLSLSFYPVGTVVELNDGAIAAVVNTQTAMRGLTCLDRPIVNLLTDAHGQALAVPRVVDLWEHRERSILRGLKGDERRRVLGKRFPVLV